MYSRYLFIALVKICITANQYKSSLTVPRCPCINTYISRFLFPEGLVTFGAQNCLRECMFIKSFDSAKVKCLVPYFELVSWSKL